MARTTIENRLIKSYWWAIPLHYILQAIVLCWLWNWYAPHVINGAHHIGLAVAFGIVLIVELFQSFRSTPTPSDALERAKSGMSVNIAKMLVVLLIGYLVHLLFV